MVRYKLTNTIFWLTLIFRDFATGFSWKNESFQVLPSDSMYASVDHFPKFEAKDKIKRWDGLTVSPHFPVSLFHEYFSKYLPKYSQEAWSLHPFWAFFASFFRPSRNIFCSSAFQGHGNWAPGSIQRMKKLRLCLKESGTDCVENSLHWTIPAHAGKGLSRSGNLSEPTSPVSLLRTWFVLLTWEALI